MQQGPFPDKHRTENFGFRAGLDAEAKSERAGIVFGKIADQVVFKFRAVAIVVLGLPREFIGGMADIDIVFTQYIAPRFAVLIFYSFNNQRFPWCRANLAYARVKA